jgi:hypothetical protein
MPPRCYLSLWSQRDDFGDRGREMRYVALWLEGRMTEARKLAAILIADTVGYGLLAGADEDRTLALRLP